MVEHDEASQRCVLEGVGSNPGKSLWVQDVRLCKMSGHQSFYNDVGMTHPYDKCEYLSVLPGQFRSHDGKHPILNRGRYSGKAFVHYDLLKSRFFIQLQRLLLGVFPRGRRLDVVLGGNDLSPAE